LEKTLSHAEGKVKDGMDIAIISVDKKAKKILYAGAMNPLFYSVNKEIFEIKADKRPIDGKPNHHFKYQKQVVPYEENTMIYLCSDGFQDQFGGVENRKFMVKRLKNLLGEISENETSEQKQILLKTFENWTNGYKQTDDVLIVGLKIRF
jgi:serine phosphatase RsbU (regulator of sigma subunit)